MAKLIREPLVHFLALAGLLFALRAVLASGDRVIEVSLADIEYRMLTLEASRGAPLTEDERRAAERAYVDEQILAREARAIGLDADARIDDILAQQMLHVLSGDVIQPTDEELAAYFERNADRYAEPVRVTIDELVVPDGGGLPGALVEGSEPEDVPAEAIVAHRVVPSLTRRDLASLFGPEHADAVLASEEGTWVGAYRSVRGDHWFRVRERFESQEPSLARSRDLVRLDWIAEEEELRLAEKVTELRGRYRVVYPELESER